MADIESQLVQFVRDEGPSLPLPGSGRTWRRFTALAQQASIDLSLGRLSEGHADALAILADAGRRPVDGATYAVWASQSKSTRTVADRVPGGWQLSGRKEFCSGSGIVDRALLVAESNQGRLLLDIDVRQHVTAVVPDTWPSIGMSASRSDTLEFGGPVVAEDDVLGTAEFYVTRPGFWFGAIGVRRLLVWRSRWHRQRSLEVPGSRT